MKLTLDHTQRLNLHALLGAQRADVGSIRAIWAIQDKIALTDDEEDKLGLKREVVDGHERLIWKPDRSLPAKEFDLSDSEAARVRCALEAWNFYSAGPDRCWLKPLIEALFPADIHPQANLCPRKDLG